MGIKFLPTCFALFYIFPYIPENKNDFEEHKLEYLSHCEVKLRKKKKFGGLLFQMKVCPKFSLYIIVR